MIAFLSCLRCFSSSSFLSDPSSLSLSVSIHSCLRRQVQDMLFNFFLKENVSPSWTLWIGESSNVYVIHSFFYLHCYNACATCPISVVLTQHVSVLVLQRKKSMAS